MKMMDKNEYKKTFSQLRPSDEVMERMLTMNKEKKTIRPNFKKILAAGLALILAGGGYGAYAAYCAKQPTPSSDGFTIVAYADDGEPITITEDGIKMMKCKVSKRKIDGKMFLDSTSTGFEILGDNIKEATFESSLYELSIYDDDMLDYHLASDDYFTVRIPLDKTAKEEYEAVEVWDVDDKTHKELVKSMMQRLDLSKYFGDQSMNVDDYWVITYWGDSSGDAPEAYYLVNKSVGKYNEHNRCGKVITEINYDEDDKISDVTMDTWVAAEYIHAHPDIKLSELPENDITVTVTYHDGTTSTKKIHTNFDDKGYLHCKIAQ